MTHFCGIASMQNSRELQLTSVTRNAFTNNNTNVYSKQPLMSDNARRRL